MGNQAVLDLSRRPEAACHLVCFPFAGGGPRAFRTWADAVPPWVGVWAAHLAGREGRFDRPPRVDLQEQVGELLDAVRPLCDRPVVLYGHSLGATLAAHVAQGLFADIGRPCALIVGARRSPWSEPYAEWATVDFASVSDADLVRAYEDLGGMDPGILGNPELLQILMPVIRSDAQLAQAPQFVREQTLSEPVHALYGRDDPFVKAENVSDWRRMTNGPFSMTEIPGDHFFFNQPTMVQDAVTPVLLSTIRRGRIPS